MVTVTKTNDKTANTFEFSDYGATIISQLSLRSGLFMVGPFETYCSV